MKLFFSILLLFVLGLTDIIQPLMNSDAVDVSWTDASSEGEREGEKTESEDEIRTDFFEGEHTKELAFTSEFSCYSIYQFLDCGDTHVEIYSPPPDLGQ